MREKDFGIWQSYDWATAWDLIETVGHALIALGVEPGDRVSIHAEDRLEWVIVDLATVAIRGITVGFYPTNPAAEVEYLLRDCGAAVHVAEDQEQYDKLEEIGADLLPDLRTIIFLEPRGMVGIDDDRLLFWDRLLELGRDHRQHHPNAVADRMAAARDDDVMTLVYTSGTTGPPKGAMLTNANSMFAVDTIVNSGDRVPGGPPTPNDQILTYLPLCHVAERIFSTWTLVGAGSVLNFAESIETVNANLREIQPTVFFAVPRIWEKLHATALIKANDATWLKKRILRAGLTLAEKLGRIRVRNDGNETLYTRVMGAIGFVFVFRALRERLGLRRVRYAATGAAAIAPEVIEFFIGIGVPVFELYGMTENSAVATSNFVGRNKVGTVGEPYPGTEVRLDPETGEIQTKHPGVFAGYWNKPDQTADTFTDDGWLRTGDVGEWVDGTHIRIIDRIKAIIITSGGKNISPSEIENSLKTSPFVKEAMVIGEGRNYLAALVSIELDTVGDWALRNDITYTTYRDLTEKPEVIELVQGVVDQTNEKFARVENVRRFALIPKELDHEDGELTATQKLKRGAMLDIYSDLVESLY